MPFSTRPDSIFDQFKEPIRKNRQPASIQTQGIHAAQLVVYDPSTIITTDGADQPLKPIITKLSLVVNGSEVEKLTRQELVEFFKFAQNNTDSNYRNVKTNNLWRHLYGVNSKQFDTYNSKTNSKGTVIEEASYCQKCGVILPLKNLTIDHQKPQQGGDVQAMLRVFRAAGLTVSTGSGQKNRALQRQFAPLVGGNQNVLQRGQRGTDIDRYTLSMKGIIYFTMLQHYKLTNEMLQMSMHHVANLRPMCGPCNSRLRNTNITWFFQS